MTCITFCGHGYRTHGVAICEAFMSPVVFSDASGSGGSGAVLMGHYVLTVNRLQDFIK